MTMYGRRLYKKSGKRALGLSKGLVGEKEGTARRPLSQNFGRIYGKRHNWVKGDEKGEPSWTRVHI